MLGTLIEDWCFPKGSNDDSQISVQRKVILHVVFFLRNSAVCLPCALRRKVQSGCCYRVSASSDAIIVMFYLSHRCCNKLQFNCKLYISSTLSAPAGTIVLIFLAYSSDVNYLIISRLPPYRNSRWICSTVRSSVCAVFSRRSLWFVLMLLCLLFDSSMF